MLPVMTIKNNTIPIAFETVRPESSSSSGARPERLLDRVTVGRDWTVDVDPVSAS